ncbi:ArsR family transcriptional regulator [Pyrococcus kukulkanii]|uniref:ArsR family transcriptional regulator n=1 Tax=Pyrococcus kukulkanii TaxID=1609559 RepID=UPI000F19F941|nr:MAG: ArsR family transcriptional regulator [Thermococci archaeon]
MHPKEFVYKVLATKKKAVSLKKLSSELETSMPKLLQTLKQLEDDGLVEISYKSEIIVKAKTLEDYTS